jgi:hypothetical protein
VIGGGSSPQTEAVSGWDKIKKGKLTASWVRMHLINHNIGGSGKKPENLVPGPKSVNSAMESFFERPVKNTILESKKTPPVMWIDANVRYHEKEKSWAEKISVQAGMYVPKKGDVWEQNKTAIFTRDFAIPKPPIAGAGEEKWSVTGGTRFALRELVPGDGVEKTDLVFLTGPRNFAVVEEVREENPGSVAEFLSKIRVKNAKLASRFERIGGRLKI